MVGAEQDGGGVGDLDFIWSQEFSWIGIKPLYRLFSLDRQGGQFHLWQRHLGTMATGPYELNRRSKKRIATTL